VLLKSGLYELGKLFNAVTFRSSIAIRARPLPSLVGHLAFQEAFSNTIQTNSAPFELVDIIIFGHLGVSLTKLATEKARKYCAA
jgi:hypothetical protein